MSTREKVNPAFYRNDLLRYEDFSSFVNSSNDIFNILNYVVIPFVCYSKDEFIYRWAPNPYVFYQLQVKILNSHLVYLINLNIRRSYTICMDNA